MTQIGPMYQSNKIVDQVLRDHNRCKIIIVTLLEEMVVQETMQLLSSFEQRSDRKNQMGALVINRSQNRLMNIDPSEIDALPVENLQKTLTAINEHIQEHNEHVELEIQQYNRLQSFLKQKGISDVPNLKIPFLSEQVDLKAQLYFQILSVLEQSEGEAL